jgi:hypothetical protein
VKNKDKVDLFRDDWAGTLPLNRPIHYAMDQELDLDLPHGRIQNLSEFELKPIKSYMEINLLNGFIQRSLWPAKAPILVANKIDCGLQLSVNLQAIITATV